METSSRQKHSFKEMVGCRWGPIQTVVNEQPSFSNGTSGHPNMSYMDSREPHLTIDVYCSRIITVVKEGR